MRSIAILLKQGSRYKNLKVHLLIRENFRKALFLPGFIDNVPLTMPSDRIIQLQKFYEEDPGDPFNLYALALEYLKYDPAKARILFVRLLEIHDGYLPTYYHAAKLFQETGDKEKAIAVYESGIALAKKLNDTKTLRELKSAYDELMFD